MLDKPTGCFPGPACLHCNVQCTIYSSFAMHLALSIRWRSGFASSLEPLKRAGSSWTPAGLVRLAGTTTVPHKAQRKMPPMPGAPVKDSDPPLPLPGQSVTYNFSSSLHTPTKPVVGGFRSFAHVPYQLAKQNKTVQNVLYNLFSMPSKKWVGKESPFS